MNGWLFKWDEAAERPRRTIFFMSLSGFVGGGVIGYFRFSHSIGYGLALGLGVALILGAAAWQNVRDPTRAARRVRIGAATLRIAVPFIALAVAVAAGAAVNSFTVFLITLAAGLAVGLVLSRIASR
jgi:hypothetical protein